MIQEVRPAASTARTRIWYVTASHRRVNRAGNGPFELPFGTAHVRKVGASETACGAPAQNWPIFWDLHGWSAEGMCTECRWVARLDRNHHQA